MTNSGQGLTVEVFIHLDVVGRQGWTGDQDERPLTEVGRKQAEKIAEELGSKPVDAIYASPNVRSRQSVEPIAKKFGLQILDAPGFNDAMDLRGQGQGEGPDPLSGAYLAGSAYSDIQKIRASMPSGRVVICSNGGDIVPALATFLAGSAGGKMPPRLERASGGGVTRGGVYTFVLTDGGASVSTRPASADFPT